MAGKLQPFLRPYKMPLYTDNDLQRFSNSPSIGPDDQGRSAFRKDYARLLHSPSFRRLQGKTQLFPGNESDFFRNRLTHSLEVAQIARGIGEMLNATTLSHDKIDLDLLEFAGIAHDLGHPPFGHNGEHALDQKMLDAGGFEGNAQTLRILTCSEKKLITPPGKTQTREYGLDLTFRAIASILKYDKEIQISREPGARLEKGYYYSESTIVDKIKKKTAELTKGGQFKTVECSIMDLADDIAYSSYDLEDAIHAEFVTPAMLLRYLLALNPQDEPIRDKVVEETNKTLKKNNYNPVDNAEIFIWALGLFDVKNDEVFDLYQKASKVLESNEAKRLAENAFAAKNNYLDSQWGCDSLISNKFTSERIGRLIRSVELEYNEKTPALSKVKLSREALIDVEMFKHLNYQLVINSPKLAIIQFRGKDIVDGIFEALIKSNGELLPLAKQKEYQECLIYTAKKRRICDYVASMTDKEALDFYNALYGTGGNLFKPY